MMRHAHSVTAVTCDVDAEDNFCDTPGMGKSPETTDGKVLKNRENKVRRTAARQGVCLVKLHRDGRGLYLLFDTDNLGTRHGQMVSKSGGNTQSGNNAMTLDEAAEALTARQRRPPPLAAVVPGPW